MLGLYEAGIDKMNDGEYQEAQEILSELGDYKDSLTQIKNAQNLEHQKEIYDKAVEAFTNEDFKGAIELFTKIEDFKDSEEYIKKSNILMEQRK